MIKDVNLSDEYLKAVTGKFDLETVRIGRRFLQLHDDMAEVLKKNGNYKIEVVTQDIVLNLLNK